MKPEWSGNPEVVPTIMLYGAAGLIAFLLLTFAFAFYW